MYRIILLSVSAVWLAACSSAPVKPSYVSPAPYQAWSCEQLRLEYNRLGQYLRQGVEVPTQKRMDVGFGLAGLLGRGGGIVPSVSVRMGEQHDSPRTVYARVLGERDAIAQTSAWKNCPSVLPRWTPATSTAPSPN